VDGFLDWYWLGVLLGLGVADGVIGREVRRPLLGTASLALFGASIVIAFLALEWWAFLAFVAAALVSWLALRRLSPAARLVAALAAAAIAFVPALGYALAVGAPIAGVRLGRRANSRFAGLRVLAKD
jgi:phosphoglycerol transferase MdoB-like AlkP superfamily enzyme